MNILSNIVCNVMPTLAAIGLILGFLLAGTYMIFNIFSPELAGRTRNYFETAIKGLFVLVFVLGGGVTFLLEMLGLRVPNILGC